LFSLVPHHCPLLELISLGRVTPYYTDKNYQPAVIGDVATYSCIEGYQLVGDVTRLCILNSNGTTQWTGTEPYCASKCIVLYRVKPYCASMCIVCAIVHAAQHAVCVHLNIV